MKIFFKAILAAGTLIVVTFAISASWLYLYSRDLPDLPTLASFAPDAPSTLEESCSSISVRAVPYSSLGRDLRNASRAAEGASKAHLALQISRGLFCNSGKRQLERYLLEYKASVQLRRQFTFEQLLTIYLNRAYFGPDLIGIENASLHFYRKHTSELNLPESVLMIGLITAPAMYSPELHPARAKMRRDAMIGAMLRQGTITAQQAAAAVNASIP